MKSAQPTRIQQLLTPIRESITNKPPYLSGTLALPASFFSLFYKTPEGGPDARLDLPWLFPRSGAKAPLTFCCRHIDLANATRDELEQLYKACEPTSSDMNKKAKTDGPAKMDLGSFSPLLAPVQTNLVNIIRDYHFEGDKSSQKLKINLRELNVYSTYFNLLKYRRYSSRLLTIGKGSSSKPRVEALPHKNMIGSLVIIFPTPHEGGILSLRSRTSHHERSFDPSPETSDTTHNPSIGYVVLLKDVEHEVAPVTSGHRVTLTYDLYAENDDGPASANVQQASESVHPLANERTFRDAFAELLESREFLADGGTLGFGLSHAYSFEIKLDNVYGALKGSDAVVYRTLLAHGFEPILRMYYHEWEPDWVAESLNGCDVVYNKVQDFSGWNWWDINTESIPEVVGWTRGQYSHPDDLQMDDDGEYEDAEVVTWVTPMTKYNRKESLFGTSSASDRSTMTNSVFGDLCLSVRIGKYGDRLSYPRIVRSEDDEDEDMDEDASVAAVGGSQGSED